MTLRSVAALVAAVAVAACVNGPVPTQGPSFSPSPQASPTINWPPFEPTSVQQAVALALGMACQPSDARIHCQAVRPSGARFDAVGPDGSDAADRELSFKASGPIELESEARRLFGTVAGAVSGDPELSNEWQDQIWAAFADPAAPTATLPNGVSWSASRQVVGDVLVWSLSLTWQTD